MDLIPVWVIQSWTQSSLWVPFNSECSVIQILACADPNYQLCCARRVSWACWHSSVSHTNCSLSWKWPWLILRKISPALFTCQNSNTAVQVPDLSELIFSWKIFLAYPSRKVWNIKKIFIAWNFFSFYIPTSERKSGIAGKEGRDSEATQGNVCHESGGKLLLSRAVPVHSLVLQKPHQLCEFVSWFLLQSPCAWDEFSHCTCALMPYTLCHQRLGEPGPHAGTVGIPPPQPEKGWAHTFPIFLLYPGLMPLQNLPVWP